ncbi:MAG: glycine betaine ABC transporter substrate-binding protein [Mycetocola sp.]
MKSFTKIAVGGIAIAGLLGMAGCASTGSGGDALDNGDAKDVNIAVFNGWDEGIAASELWKAILTEQGYNVELTYADPAPVYAGLSTNDYDLTLDTWLPVTHKSYIDEYGDKMTDLGAWNDEAKLTIAVNEDAPIDSLDELADNADLFGNQLIGIEPGAGLTEVTTNEVIPQYGLEDFNYVTSSTPAMLTELKAATDKGDNVLVTLWRPHWAYDAFPIKDLEDPKGALGGAESIHSYGSGEFEEKYPTLSGWIKNFKMDNEHLYSLENAMFNDAASDDYGPAVEAWIAENQDYVDGLTK